MLSDVAALVRDVAEDAAIVHIAHMELAEPSIATGFAACVRDGATEVVVFPYMLSPGKHSILDIPRMVAEVARAHPAVTFFVTPPFGVERELAQIIARRAGLDRAESGSQSRKGAPR